MDLKLLLPALNYFPNLIYTKNLQGEYTYINKKFQEIFKTKEEKILGKTDLDLFPKQVALNIQSSDKAVIQFKKKIEEEENLVVGNEPRVFLSIKFPLYDNEGNLHGIGTISSDITEKNEHRKAEIEIERRELQFKAVQQLAHVGTWEMEFPSEKIFWSEELYKLFNKKKGEFSLTFESFESFIHPEDLPKFIEMINKVIHSNENVDFHIRLKSDNNNGRILHFIGIPVLNNEKKLISIMGVVQDVTEEKKSEELAYIREQQLEEAQNIAGLGYWEWNVSKNTVTWSPELYRIFEVVPNSIKLTFESYLERVHPDDRESVKKAIEDARDNKSSFFKYERIVMADNSIKYLKTGGKVYLDNSGNVVKMIGVCNDITDLKEAELEILKVNSELENRVEERTKELEIAIKDLESFAHNVSHDLKAPLRSINGFAKIINEKYRKYLDQQGLDFLDFILDNAKKMKQLIDDLLAFSLSGKKPLNKTDINMSQLVSSVVREINRQKIHNSEIKISELPDATADYSLLSLVFNNLISNALKYSSKTDHPVIEIYGKEEENRIVYSVRDNGIGFDMKYYDKLFGVFQRIVTQVDFEGTGVGLALSKRIIERHKGKIWAESEGAGKGATFHFSLPPPI